MKKFVLLLLVILLAAGVVFAFLFFFLKEKQTITADKKSEIKSIANFKDCADVGYPVMMGYPRVCRTPGGKFFSEEQASEKQINLDEDKKIYASFALNINDYIDDDLSLETVNKLLDIYDKYSVKADLYFTEPVLKAYEKSNPKLIERIKNSKHAVNYHFRPPHPAYDTFIKKAKTDKGCEEIEKLSYDKKVELFSNFEKYELNVDYKLGSINHCSEYNKQKVGGYKYVASVFGKNPIIVGVANIKNEDIEKAEAYVLKEMGAKIVVAEHFGGSRNNDFLKKHGLFERPSDFGFSFVNRNTQQAADLFLSDGEKMELKREAFGVLVVHDYDFYKTKSWDYTGSDKSFYRSEKERDDLLKNYEKAVKNIAESKDVAVFAADDVLSFLEAREEKK